MTYMKDEAGKKKIIEALTKFMGDSALVYIKIHGFHWNIVGPHFKSLHELFEEHYTNLWESLDEIAERIRALGGKAPGSFAELIEVSTIEEFNTAPTAQLMLNKAYVDYEKLISYAHQVEKVAEEYGDTFTVDMMTQRVGELEKMAWMTMAHLQGGREG